MLPRQSHQFAPCAIPITLLGYSSSFASKSKNSAFMKAYSIFRLLNYGKTLGLINSQWITFLKTLK